MMKLKKSEYKLICPFGEWAATSQPDTVTNAMLESVPYLAEYWDYKGKTVEWSDEEAVILTFDEIKACFDAWDQEKELTEIYGTYDESEIYKDAHDWLRDTCYNFFHPVKIIKKGV